MTFKAEYLTGHGTPDALAPALRGRPGRWLEGCLRGRHKFQHPRSWARGPLGDFVRDLLTTSELPDHLDRAAVRSLTNAQLSGRGSDWSSMDKLITSALTTQLLLKATAWRVR